MDQLAIQHRIAVAFIRAFGHEIGSSIVASTARIGPCALVAILMYLYLSPERYPK